MVRIAENDLNALCNGLLNLRIAHQQPQNVQSASMAIWAMVHL